MASFEQRSKWAKMGLCVNCGGLRFNPEYDMCARCREKAREMKIRRKYGDAGKKIKIPREVSPNHKCWNCVWSTFVGDGFYCPRPVGTCVKEKKQDD